MRYTLQVFKRQEDHYRSFSYNMRVDHPIHDVYKTALAFRCVYRFFDGTANDYSRIQKRDPHANRKSKREKPVGSEICI